MGPGRGRGGRAMMRGRGRGGRFRGRGMRKLTRTLAFILGTMQTERGSGKRRRWSWPKHWNALPSPLEDAYSDALHTNHMIEYEPAVDIDEKPPMSILEAPEKCKPFLMAYEVIQSQEELELHEVDKKELMDVYCGPDRVTAKQQKQELERVAKTLPEDTPSSVRRFADQALLSPQSNTVWGFNKKCQFMDKLVREIECAAYSIEVDQPQPLSANRLLPFPPHLLPFPRALLLLLLLLLLPGKPCGGKGGIFPRAMESIFSDPTKCSHLSLEEKRELVHEISRWADNAPEILQSWSRRELLQLICAEMGKERKYTGVTKPKMIEHLLRLVSQNKGKTNEDKAGLLSASPKSPNGIKKKRKKENPLQNSSDLTHETLKTKEEHVDALICQNPACRATLSLDVGYCKRCSCCICHHYDDNKDPSLWLVCNSDPPYCGNSCGMSCHLKCALKHEKAGILKTGCSAKLDASFYCVCCGKVNWLIGSWRKQMLTAKEARRVDVLCERLSLSYKMLKGTECYKELQNIVNAAVRILKKEVGPLDKVSTVMARGIVNRLNCGAEVQKLCVTALEVVDSLLSTSSDNLPGMSMKASVGVGSQIFHIDFEDTSPFSVVVSLHSRDDMFEENIIGCSLWYRKSDDVNYPEEPNCLVLRPDTKIMISGLSPSTEYHFRVSPFSSTKELGRWDAKCVTESLNGNSGQCSTRNSDSTYINEDFLSVPKKEQDLGELPVIIQSDSQKGSTNSSENNQAAELPEFSRANHHKVVPSEDASDNNESHLPPPSNSVPFICSKPLLLEPCKPDVNNTPDSANKKESAERQYEYCVKVIRWLECEGHMEKEFRVKFLTWFSLKATAQERRVVNAFIDVLIDEPASLVAQLMDTFMDGISNKEKPMLHKGFCTRMWH
ncbi:protein VERNALIZATION INSENSITIVE [Musa troglodytarum]|uniref:Protein VERNALIZATION INSENSITIVE n=1 Tax=Musa troglodytarum TaxID=320322 RepID=A0A9E7KVZ9_9LILI|nr:protein VERNALIZATION INSENSITIVE [Musa troglodytarum]